MLKGPSSDMTEMMDLLARPITILTLAVWSLPLLFVAWRVWRAPLRTWVPIVPIIFFVALILTLQFVDGLLGPGGMMALIYLLAGAGSR